MVTRKLGLGLFCASALLLAGCPGDGDLGDNDDGNGGDEANDDGGDDNGDDGQEGDDEAGEGEGDGDSGNDTGPPPTCEESDCPLPKPAAPSIQCRDGTIGGPACVDQGNGTCAWEIIECPDCTEEECGPAPGAPSVLCPDGVHMSGPGPCEEIDGVCGWTFLECPECCEPSEQPQCIEGATCCADGTWQCNNGAGEPPCEETALPCTDGGQCVPEQGSCAMGEQCCDGLQCCAGVPVPPGSEFCGIICPVSDRNKKEHFHKIDNDAILKKVSELEITTWNYTFEDPSVRHLGPMAQDFKASFEIGRSDKAIFQVDADGVALASIQALHAQIKKLEKTNAALEKRIAELEAKK